MKTKLSKTQLVILKDRGVEASFMYFNHEYVVFNFTLDKQVFTRVIDIREAKAYIAELLYDGFYIATIIGR